LRAQQTQDQNKEALRADQAQQNRVDAFKNDAVDTQRDQAARDAAGLGNAQANLMKELQSMQMNGGGANGDPQKAIQSLGLNPNQTLQATSMASALLSEIRAGVAQQMSMASQMNSSQQQTQAEQDQQQAAVAGASAGGGMGGPATASSAISATDMMNDTSGGAGSDDPAVMKVIQGATGSVYAELYGMVQKMEDTRLQKKALTDYISILSQAAASKSFPVKVPLYEMSFNEKTGKVEMKFKGMKEMSKEEITALKEKATGIKDSLSEMTTMDQLTLQQCMEKKGQFESIFSNMLKSYQQTSQGVLSNLK
jgi:hypothetical protein